MSNVINGESSRMAACWRIQDCGSCLASTAGCGWCPMSSTCVPASSLFEPIRHAVCPLQAERFELRTRALGCGCSTITLLSVLVTVLATLVATLILYGVWRAQVVQWMWRIFGPGSWEGWERVEEEDGTVKERLWRRGGRRWILKLFSGLADDEDTLEERTRLIGAP